MTETGKVNISYEIMDGGAAGMGGKATYAEIKRMEKSSICANMRAVRYYLKYCYEKPHGRRTVFKASRLLEHEIPFPVIAEILGHTSTQTTMTYLCINIAELKKCALEVTV